MQYAVLPIFLFLVCVVGLAVGLVIAGEVINPGRPGRVRQMPYESGMDPIHDTRRRFHVRFYLLAIAFLVFDVELLFLFPWAVASRPAAAVEGSGAWGVGQGTGSAFPIQAGSEEGSGFRVQGPDSAGHPSSLAPRPSPLAPPLGIDAAVADGLVESRRLVFAGAMTFLALLVVGFVYDWRKGVFQWG